MKGDKFFLLRIQQNHSLDSYSSLNTSNSKCISGWETADNSRLPLQRRLNTLDPEISSFDELYNSALTNFEDGGRV